MLVVAAQMRNSTHCIHGARPHSSGGYPYERLSPKDFHLRVQDSKRALIEHAMVL